MKSILTLSAGLILAGSISGALADPAQDLTLRAETPVVEVSPRQTGRQFLDLPALEFAFDIQARCDETWTPESLSLNVADSRVTFDSAALSRNALGKITLSVPSRQLAPVAVHDFCLQQAGRVATEPGTAAPPTPESALLTIRAVLSAQASLLCASPEERRITYVSQPLDVVLSCGTPAAIGPGD